MPESYRKHSVSLCKEEVQAVREVYACFDSDSAVRRLIAFDSCRNRSWFVRHDDTGDVRVATKSCKSRWCPLCAKKRQWFLTEQIKPWAESVPRLKFFTVTLKHSNAPLRDQIANLYQYFQKFRKLKYLRENIHGGVWFFQIKKSEKTGQWHPHLHCLLDADFMSQEKLSGLWCKTTNGSTIVDIREAKDPASVAEYVGRYAARPSSMAELDLGERVTLFEALHGRRLMGMWGSARVITTKMEAPEDASKWRHVGYWSTVSQTLKFDDNARKILSAWKNNKPLEPNINMRHIECGVDGCCLPKPSEPPETRQMLLFDMHVKPL